MPIRNDNIDLLLLVAGEYATNDEEHFESYLFINGTTLYTNDSYFDTNGWIDPGTYYHKTEVWILKILVLFKSGIKKWDFYTDLFHKIVMEICTASKTELLVIRFHLVNLPLLNSNI